MSIISRLFNSTSTPAKPVQSPALQPAQSAGYNAVVKVNDTRDEFAKKFFVPFYLPGIVWRHNQAQCANPPLCTKAILSEVIEPAGELFSKTDAAEIEKARKHLAWCETELQKCSFVNIGELYRAQHAAVAQDIAAEKQGEVGKLASRNEVGNAISIRRQAIHTDKRQTWARSLPILTRACNKLNESARAAVTERDASEQLEAETYGLRFVPSDFLRALVFIAFRALAPVADASEGLGCVVLSTEPKDIWPELHGHVAVVGGPVKSQREIESDAQKRRQQEINEESEAERKAKHAAELEKINAFNDAIRNQPLK